MIRGRITEEPYPDEPDERHGILHITWQKKDYAFELGATGVFLDALPTYKERVFFLDMDGDQTLEMAVVMEGPAASRITYIAFSDEGATVLLQQSLKG